MAEEFIKVPIESQFLFSHLILLFHAMNFGEKKIWFGLKAIFFMNF